MAAPSPGQGQHSPSGRVPECSAEPPAITRPLWSTQALLLLLALVTVSGCRACVTGRPSNLLLISIDTCRADALGCYGGSPTITPHLDALARDGVRFVNVVSPVPITLPAHASVMTGLSPARHGLHYNLGHTLRPEHETLAELLAARGFSTAAFVSSVVLSQRFGLGQGFATYDDRMSSTAATVFGAERPGGETVKRAVHWLRQNRGQRFFLFVHLYDPHEPYQAPPEFAARFPSSPYLAEVAAADACVGQLVGTLADLALERSTVVAVVGDHGEMLGEHGEETHTYFVYQSALRVPFILRLPQRPPVQLVASLTGLVDVMPTLCGLLGVPPPAGSEGHDFSTLLLGRSQAPTARSFYCESMTPTRYGASSLRGLVGERWKLIQSTRAELYDLVDDPGETNNLVALEETVVAEQARALAAILDSQDDQSTAPGEATAPDVDREILRQLASLGYASSPVDASVEVVPSRPDAKDLVAVHVAHTRALQLMSVNDFAAAEPLSRRVLEALPASWEANLTLGKVAVGLGRWSGAVALFERSLQLRPAQYEALRGLGEALSGQGELAAATSAFRRALALDPEPPRAALDLARALNRQGQHEEARGLMAQAVRLAPRRLVVIQEVARLLDEQAQRGEAINFLESSAERAREAGDTALAKGLELQLADLKSRS